MSIASANQTINWCPPVHRNVSPSNNPINVTLSPGFVVLITGSSRGIGLATAIAYAKAGASAIMLTGRNKDALNSAKKQVLETAALVDKVQGMQVETFACDVCSEEDTRSIANYIQAKYGKLDALILNAGKANGLVRDADGNMDWPHDASALDLSDFRQTFEVNFFSGVVAIKYFIPLIQAAASGSPKSIIWITSSSIHHYDPKFMAMGYSLSKFAAARFVEYVHEAHKDKGVTTFGIQPGSVMTDMSKYQLPEGKGWEKILIDNVNLGGALCVWLTKERREWLSGRWVDARWDTDELERRKEDILTKNLLKFRMTA
ncbi:uncharacterized protein PV09_02462 [Verruconis gallopava]|uniref:Uncharacterized protein n=1 Tax=Verruconis gallopava TaxID=253628 RepID=A0A0D2AIQ0_9PEZI|nr:uncharacterized protein PV09_02462 [Verruconis gallopava]KIW06778.1 hypothetical protein PV09_02462 [Verruconis gallopava]